MGSNIKRDIKTVKKVFFLVKIIKTVLKLAKIF